MNRHMETEAPQITGSQNTRVAEDDQTRIDRAVGVLRTRELSEPEMKDRLERLISEQTEVVSRNVYSIEDVLDREAKIVALEQLLSGVTPENKKIETIADIENETKSMQAEVDAKLEKLQGKKDEPQKRFEDDLNAARKEGLLDTLNTTREEEIKEKLGLIDSELRYIGLLLQNNKRMDKETRDGLHDRYADLYKEEVKWKKMQEELKSDLGEEDKSPEVKSQTALEKLADKGLIFEKDIKEEAIRVKMEIQTLTERWMEYTDKLDENRKSVDAADNVWNVNDELLDLYKYRDLLREGLEEKGKEKKQFMEEMVEARFPSNKNGEEEGKERPDFKVLVNEALDLRSEQNFEIETFRKKLQETEFNDPDMAVDIPWRDLLDVYLVDLENKKGILPGQEQDLRFVLYDLLSIANVRPEEDVDAELSFLKGFLDRKYEGRAAEIIEKIKEKLPQIERFANTYKPEAENFINLDELEETAQKLKEEGGVSEDNTPMSKKELDELLKHRGAMDITDITKQVRDELKDKLEKEEYEKIGISKELQDKLEKLTKESGVKVPEEDIVVELEDAKKILSVQRNEMSSLLKSFLSDKGKSVTGVDLRRQLVNSGLVLDHLSISNDENENSKYIQLHKALNKLVNGLILKAEGNYLTKEDFARQYDQLIVKIQDYKR